MKRTAQDIREGGDSKLVVRGLNAQKLRASDLDPLQISLVVLESHATRYASQWLHSTVTRGTPLSAAPKSWRQIASTSVTFGSLGPHHHQRAFRQPLRHDLRSQPIRNTRLDPHRFQFS